LQSRAERIWLPGGLDSEVLARADAVSGQCSTVLSRGWITECMDIAR